MPGPLTRLRYWLLARRRARQRRDLRTLLMLARARLDGAHRVLAKVLHARDAERDRLVRQIDAGRRAAEAVVEALQARMLGGAVGDDDLLRAAEAAVEVLREAA